MSHLQRSLPNSKWVVGYVPLGADLARVDQNTFVAINADLGGTWLPLVPITILGAGVIVAGPWTFGGNENETTGLITFDQTTPDDYFGLAPGHSGRTPFAAQNLMEVYGEFPDARVDVVSTVVPGLGLSPLVNGVVESLVPGARFQVPIRAYDSSRIIQAQFLFRILETHASVPANLPRFRVVAVDDEGTVFPMRAIDSDTDVDGFVTPPTPATGAAWSAGGVVQSLAYGCNQNNEVDVGSFSYFVEIIDESGAGAWTTTGNLFVAALLSFDSVEVLDARA